MIAMPCREGFQHIELGIRLAEFVALTRDLPRKIVTNGVEIHLKYAGQPVTCYRCNSTEHIVKNCPRQRWQRPVMPSDDTESGGGEGTSVPALPPEHSMEVTSEPAAPSAIESSSLSASETGGSATPSNAAVTQNLFTDSPPEGSPKRPPSSPAKTDPPAKADITAPKPLLVDSAFLKRFLHGLQKTRSERSKLMQHISGNDYYCLRGLYFQHLHGNYSDADLPCLTFKPANDKETQAWSGLHSKLSTDAYGDLNQFREHIGGTCLIYLSNNF